MADGGPLTDESEARPGGAAPLRLALWQRNLVALTIAQGVTQLAFSFALPLTPLYVMYLGVATATEAAWWAGLIAGATSVTLTFSQPIWGQLADRWGHRPMVLRAMIGGSISLTLQGLAGAPVHLFILRLLQGTVSGSIYASNALIATVTPRHRLGLALGVMQVASLGGSALGPLVGGLLADSVGFRVALFLAGGLMVVSTVLVLLFCREERVKAASTAARAGGWRASLAALRAPGLAPLIAVMFLVQLGTVVVLPVLSLFVAELSQSPNAATTAGLVIAAGGATSALAALALGYLGDRLGQRLILPICLAGAAITYLPQAFVQDVGQLLWLRLLLGLFLGGMLPTANALVADLVPPERRGTTFGLTAAGSSLAHAVGPVAGALIASAWGLRAVFLVTSLLFAIGLVWVGLSRRPRRPSVEAS